MFPLLFVLHPHQHGWRWAIYRVAEQEMLANPRSGCINAGFQGSQADADAVGQLALYTVISFVTGVLKSGAPVTTATYNTDLTPDDTPMAWHLKGSILQMGV